MTSNNIYNIEPAQTPTAHWRRTLYITFVAQLVTAVGFSIMFPFLPLYIKDLGTTTQLNVEFLAGMVYSANAFAMMIVSPIWGVVADRYSRKLMLVRAMIGGSVILLTMAFVRSAEELVLLRFIQGLITGSVAAANALVAATVPRQRMGYAMGLIQTGMGAGVAVGPLIGGAIADAFGYNAAFFITATLLFISGIMVWLGVEENFIPLEEQTQKQESFLAEWRHVLSTPGVITTYSLRFTSELGRMMLLPIAPLFILSLLPNSNYINTFTGLVVGVSAATITLSALFLGRLGDRTGHRRIVVVSALAGALLFLLHSLVTEGWQLLVLQAMVGVCLGGIIPAISALLGSFAQMGETGAVYGLDNSIIAGSRSVAPLLGSTVAVLFNLRATFVAIALFFFATALLAAWRLPQVPKFQATQPATEQV